MSDIKLFRHDHSSATELAGVSALVEKHLQQLIEKQMETFLGVRFLASEYSTGKTHKGRIDSLGLDENGCPVIIEYKRHTNENVMTQGLFYLDWLLDHRAEFWKLVLDQLGKDEAEKIEWSGTRLICIAGDFTRYDEHAVGLMPRNIELIRYKLFGPDLILFEQVNSVTVEDASQTDESKTPGTGVGSAKKSDGKLHADQLATATPELLTLFENLVSYIHSLGDDIQQKQLKRYVAFSRIKNFICATLVSKHDPHVRLWVKLNPETVALEEGFTRDVRNIGHWATGDLEVFIRNSADLDKAKGLIDRSYQEN
jgi:predicted transport protein